MGAICGVAGGVANVVDGSPMPVESRATLPAPGSAIQGRCCRYFQNEMSLFSKSATAISPFTGLTATERGEPS
jgi:hypothetical protein